MSLGGILEILRMSAAVVGTSRFDDHKRVSFLHFLIVIVLFSALIRRILIIKNVPHAKDD